MTQTITARHLITDIGTVEFAVIALTPEGNIAEVYSDPKALHNDDTTLTAAFLDVHTHGAIGLDVMTASPADFSRLQLFLASHGVAHYLPSTITDAVDATLRSLESIANAIEAAPREGEARPIGIHIEGPFLSHLKRGMHPTEHLQRPSIPLFDRLFQAARGQISLMTIAPEPEACINPIWQPTNPAILSSHATNPGAPSSATAPSSPKVGASGPPTNLSPAIDLIRHATTLGVRCSIGHTNALAAETLLAIDAGAVSATHTFNAMRPLDHREPGVLGTVLDDDRLFAELICDGVHVAPPLVRLWLKAKTAARGILVTDALSAAGMPDGDYTLGSTAVHVANARAVVKADLALGKETLAGSIVTLDQCVQNLRSFTGASLADATRLASHNPAAMLGLPQLTRLAPGSPANLNRFDAEGRLIATYLQGKQV